jgi:hypothetical protein
MNIKKLVIITSICTGLCLVLASSVSTAFAEEKTVVVKRVLVADEDDQLSKELQEELESSNRILADPDCVENCGTSTATDITTPDDGSTRYTCNGSNCACSGACECVAMDEICMPDTIGCSDYGCTCKGNPDVEHKQPNCG